MDNILPFKGKKDAHSNLNVAMVFLTDLIADHGDKTNIMEFTMAGVRVTVQHYDSLFEDVRAHLKTEDLVMLAAGLPSLMMQTPEAQRQELFDVATIEIQLWEWVTGIDHFVTARTGSYDYSFRTANDTIAHVLLELISYDKTT